MTKKTAQKTTTNTSEDCASSVVLQSAKKTTGLPVRQFHLKKAIDVNPTKASGQVAKIFITKPQ